MDSENIHQSEGGQPGKQPDKKGNLVACLGYCPALFFVPYIFNVEDEDEKTMNKTCGQQGLWLLIAFIAMNLIRSLFSYAYFYYSPVNVALNALNIILLAVTVIGMLRAYNGKVLVLPVVGKIDLIKKAMGN